MYNDTIKVANKIITDKDLEEIFMKMHEEIEMCEKQAKLEIAQNERYEREYQTWTLKNYSYTFKVDVNFYDDTNISFDSYYNFMSIFNSRLHEIKNFHLRYHCSYYRQYQGQSDKYISQHITMDVYEEKMNIDVDLNSEDKIMNQIYDIIKQKVLSAPEKYDRIIRKKSSIYNKVGFAIGFIPASIILSLLVFVPVIRQIYGMSYVGFPIACLLMAFMIGTTFCGGKLDRLYKNIIPEKKYAGYDSTNYKSIYKDDIDKYVETSEILIGKNIDNLRDRTEIKNMEEKYSKYIPTEIIVLIVLSILMILLGKLI